MWFCIVISSSQYPQICTIFTSSKMDNQAKNEYFICSKNIDTLLSQSIKIGIFLQKVNICIIQIKLNFIAVYCGINNGIHPPQVFISVTSSLTIFILFCCCGIKCFSLLDTLCSSPRPNNIARSPFQYCLTRFTPPPSFYLTVDSSSSHKFPPLPPGRCFLFRNINGWPSPHPPSQNVATSNPLCCEASHIFSRLSADEGSAGWMSETLYVYIYTWSADPLQNSYSVLSRHMRFLFNYVYYQLSALHNLIRSLKKNIAR